jgi:hypothetical protein
MNATDCLRVRPERRDTRSRELLLARVRAEFQEMPCLRLTRPQAQRLFGLRLDVCERVLATLVRQREIYLGSDGRYWRPDHAQVRKAPSPAERRQMAR